MKKQLLQTLLGFNYIWMHVFIGLQILILGIVISGGKHHQPYCLEQYVEKGGTKTDYYLGYSFFTVNNSGTNYNLPESQYWSPAHESLVRYIYLGLYIILWICGFMALDVFTHYKYPLVWPRINPHIPPTETASSIKEAIFTLVFSSITTAISLYGIYYSWIYIKQFWLE